LRGRGLILAVQNNHSGYLEDFDFIVESGRAVMFPVYKGMCERWNDFSAWSKTSSFYRDVVIAWSKDLGRSIATQPTSPNRRTIIAAVSVGIAPIILSFEYRSA
jgi:hypothetical protein